MNQIKTEGEEIRSDPRDASKNTTWRDLTTTWPPPCCPGEPSPRKAFSPLTINQRIIILKTNKPTQYEHL